MKILITIFFLSSMFLIQMTSAKEILIKSPELPIENFNVFISNNSDYQSFTQGHIHKLKSSPLVANLNQLFANAQKKYLEPSIEESIDLFLKIVSMTHSYDWPKNERNIIYYSFFRLAQLQPNNLHDWLDQAIAFAPEMQPNKQLFPPPLIQNYLSLKKHKVFLNWRLSESFSPYTTLLINGKTYDLKQTRTISIPLNQSRITILSNSLKPITKVMTGESLLTWQPQQAAFIGGSCENPIVFQENLRNISGLYPNDCIANLSKQTHFNLKPIPQINSKALKTLPPPLSAANQPWLKNKWTWIGVGAVVISAIVYSQSRTQAQVLPTHKKEN